MNLETLPVKTDPAEACDNCGQFGALEIAGRSLCPDCVAAAGCGCGGLGGADEN